MTSKHWLAACLVILTATVTANAWWRSPALYTPLGIAPDACGPGFYTVSTSGVTFGPNYYVYPPCAPFNGLLAGPELKKLQQLQGNGIPPWYQAPAHAAPPGYSQGLPAPGYARTLPAPGYSPYPTPLPYPGYSPPVAPAGPAGFPSHPFARSPRDFFMWSDVMQDQLARGQRPALVP